MSQSTDPVTRALAEQTAAEELFRRLIFGPGDSALAPASAGSVEADLHRAEGLAIYRELGRDRVGGALRLMLERTLSRLGPSFDEYFDKYLGECPPLSRYLLDIPGQFLDFCEPLWSLDSRVPEYLVELGRHELLEVEIAAYPDETENWVPVPLSADAGLSFVSCRLVQYRYAVHCLPDDPADRTQPLLCDTRLLAFRDSSDAVRYLELSLAAYQLVHQLMGGCSLLASIQAVGMLQRRTMDDFLLSECNQLLVQFVESGVALVPRAATPANPSVSIRSGVPV
jgi:hypothetical protein